MIVLKTDIINALAAKINAITYLEIGVGTGRNLKRINVPHKVSVDPEPSCRVTHEMTSVEFFTVNEKTFDLIFIDGLHEFIYALVDIEESLSILNPGGVIVVHDVNPTSKEMQLVPRQQLEWTGDVWKAWVYHRTRNPYLEMYTVDTDYGVGVIRKGEQEVSRNAPRKPIYEDFVKHRQEWLNLISVEEFIQREVLAIHPAGRSHLGWA